MRGGRADRHRPALLYTYIYGEASGPYSSSATGWGLAPTGPHMPIPIYGETVRALSFPIRGRMQYAPTLTVDCFHPKGEGATAYAPSDVPVKGTNAGARLFRRAIYWRRPGPAVPVCGAYAIRPYASGRLFSSVRVGAYCIRPTRRSRQGDEGGFWVVSQGDLLGSFGPCPSSAMGWGLAPTGPHLLFLS